MDPDVDKHYLQKYYPSGGRVRAHPHPQDDLHSSYATTEYRPSPSSHYHDPITELTASYAEMGLIQIEPEDPSIPCYLATLPDELLMHIILQLSLSTLASLARTAQVCKKFLLLTHAEKSLYKALCLHYFAPFSSSPALLLPEFDGDWRRMLIERPRLRFDGCYIATCHYLRPGVCNFSWNTPIHTVTYFRFLRFFRDGRVLSVLTTLEPREVVYSVSWAAAPGLKGVSEGTWSMTDTGQVSVKVTGPREYTFVMELQVKSTTRGKHNKLGWVAFYSVNREGGERTVRT